MGKPYEDSRLRLEQPFCLLCNESLHDWEAWWFCATHVMQLFEEAVNEDIEKEVTRGRS